VPQTHGASVTVTPETELRPTKRGLHRLGLLKCSPLDAKRVDVEYAGLLGRPRRCTAPARNCSRCSHCRASSGTRLSAFGALCCAGQPGVVAIGDAADASPDIRGLHRSAPPTNCTTAGPLAPGDRDAVYRLVPTDSIHRPDRVDRPTCDQTPGAPLRQISSTRAGPAIKNDAERDRGFASAHRSGSRALPQPGTRRGDRGNPRRIPSCGVCGGLLRGCACLDSLLWAVESFRGVDAHTENREFRGDPFEFFERGVSVDR